MFPQNRNPWVVSGVAAVTGHGAIIAGILFLAGQPRSSPPEEPVVLVELPPPGGLAVPVSATQVPIAAEQPSAMTPVNAAQFDVPEVVEHVPRDVVVTPPKRLLRPPVQSAQNAPQPLAVAAGKAKPALSQVATPASTASVGPGSADSAGTNSEAKRQEADYFAMLGAHLNRRKHYPAQARKARQQGVVTVRFTVHADGSISASSIRKSSGHALLDEATLDLMQRVAPLPKFPKSMARDQITISLPIDYSLRTQ